MKVEQIKLHSAYKISRKNNNALSSLRYRVFDKKLLGRGKTKYWHIRCLEHEYFHTDLESIIIIPTRIFIPPTKRGSIFKPKLIELIYNGKIFYAFSPDYTRSRTLFNRNDFYIRRIK